MNETINSPLICLKVGVPYVLCNGERIALTKSPVKEGKNILLPVEALALIGINYDGDYVALDSLSGLNVVYASSRLLP